MHGDRYREPRKKEGRKPARISISVLIITTIRHRFDAARAIPAKLKNSDT